MTKAENAEPCRHAWPGRDGAMHHICYRSGEHARHRCGVCGAYRDVLVTPPGESGT